MEHHVLVCVPFGAESGPLLAEGASLARVLGARLCAVYLYPEGWRGPRRGGARAWHLDSDSPEKAVRAFAAARRVTRIVMPRMGLLSTV
jgi:hypothetical protein